MRLLACLTTALISGCGLIDSEPNLLTITTDQSVYTSTQEIRLDFENRSASVARINWCDWRLDVRIDGSWRTVLHGRESFALCIGTPLEISARATTSTPWSLPQELDSGDYRLRFQVVVERHHVESFSNTFTLQH